MFFGKGGQKRPPSGGETVTDELRNLNESRSRPCRYQKKVPGEGSASKGLSQV